MAHLLASGRSARRVRGNQRRRQLMVEGLESRRVFSVDLVGGELIVHGTPNDDNLGVYLDGATLKVNDNGVLFSTPSAGVTKISVYGEAGNDRIVVAEGPTQPAYLVGGEGNDSIQGGGGGAYILGNAGDDRLSGGTGRDFILGGAGNDAINGGRQNDVLLGGEGNDEIRGGDGNDLVVGGAGDDVIGGGTGDDLLFGDLLPGGAEPPPDVTVDPPPEIAAIAARISPAAVALVAEVGDAPLMEGPGLSFNDIIEAGAGNDAIFGQLGADILRGGDGDDYLNGGVGRDQLFGDAGNDRLVGGAGNDLLNGGTGSDRLFGGDGADWLVGGPGEDFLSGGADADKIDALDGEVDHIVHDPLDMVSMDSFDLFI